MHSFIRSIANLLNSARRFSDFRRLAFLREKLIENLLRFGRGKHNREVVEEIIELYKKNPDLYGKIEDLTYDVLVLSVHSKFYFFLWKIFHRRYKV